MMIIVGILRLIIDVDFSRAGRLLHHYTIQLAAVCGESGSDDKGFSQKAKRETLGLVGRVFESCKRGLISETEIRDRFRYDMIDLLDEAR